MIELKNSITRKEIPENKNPEKVVNIVEKTLNFNNQQEGKGRSCMLASRPSDLARIDCVVKVYNR